MKSRILVVPAALLGIFNFCFLGVTRSPGQVSWTGEPQRERCGDPAILGYLSRQPVRRDPGSASPASGSS